MVPLHIRLVDGRAFHQGVKTQTFVNPLLWDDKKECIKNRALCDEEMRQKVTREINSLRMHVFDSYNEDKRKGKTDTPNWLQKLWKSFTLLMEIQSLRKPQLRFRLIPCMTSSFPKENLVRAASVIMKSFVE